MNANLSGTLTMYMLIGVFIGCMINFAVIKPIERRYNRKKCIENGLAPKDAI